jgi:hypothetical protein
MNKKLLHLDLNMRKGGEEQNKEHRDVTSASHLVKIGEEKPEILEISSSCYISMLKKISSSCYNYLHDGKSHNKSVPSTKQ